MGARGSKETSQQSSQQASFSQSGQASDSLSLGSSFNFGQSYIDPTQKGMLQWLYEQGQASADPAGARAAAEGVRDMTMPALGGAIGNVSGLGDPSASIAAQMGSLQSGLGDLFRNELNPAIESNAIAAGALGGGRQGVAQGAAIGQLADAFTRGYGDIVQRANQTALGASALLPQLAASTSQVAQAPYTANMDVLGQLAAILGAPTVLNTTQGGSGTISGSSSRGAAVSRSRGQSSGSSESGSFGFSLVPF